MSGKGNVSCCYGRARVSSSSSLAARWRQTLWKALSPSCLSRVTMIERPAKIIVTRLTHFGSETDLDPTGREDLLTLRLCPGSDPSRGTRTGISVGDEGNG